MEITDGAVDEVEFEEEWERAAVAYQVVCLKPASGVFCIPKTAEQISTQEIARHQEGPGWRALQIIRAARSAISNPGALFVGDRCPQCLSYVECSCTVPQTSTRGPILLKTSCPSPELIMVAVVTVLREADVCGHVQRSDRLLRNGCV